MLDVGYAWLGTWPDNYGRTYSPLQQDGVHIMYSYSDNFCDLLMCVVYLYSTMYLLVCRCCIQSYQFHIFVYVMQAAPIGSCVDEKMHILNKVMFDISSNGANTLPYTCFLTAQLACFEGNPWSIVDSSRTSNGDPGEVYFVVILSNLGNTPSDCRWFETPWRYY